MNQDDKHGETALIQARSDIRSLIEGSESYLVALNAMTGLFLAAWAGSHRNENQSDALDDRDVINELTDKMVAALKLSESFSRAVRTVNIGLHRMHKRNLLSEKTANQLRLGALLSAPTEEVYCKLHDWLQVLDLRTPAGRWQAATVFDDAVRFMVDRGRKLLSQFITPVPVAELMLELADVEPNDKIYDPCFGFGELLVGAARRVNAASPASLQRMSVRSVAISGVESQESAYFVTLCRLLLAGIDGPRLQCDDSLKRPLPSDDSESGFDCILAAPPWGARSIELSYDHFPIASAHAEDLFLQHVMANLRPGGRAVVALPERTLFDAESLALRQALLSEYRVDGVVALPAGAFEPCTSISTSIVVFSRAEPREAVRFVMVSPMAWEAVPAEASDHTKGQSGDELPRLPHGALLREVPISEMIVDHRELPAGSASPGVESFAVPVYELALRDYELIAKRSGSEMLDAEIERLVEAEPSLRVRRLDEVAEVFEGQENDAFDIAEDDPGYVAGELLRPADVIDVGMRRPSFALTDIGRQELTDGTAWVRERDLLVPMVETVGSIGLIEDIEDWSGVLADSGVALIRVREGIKPHFLAALLRSPAYWFWLSGHATGSTIRRLSIPVLRTLKIPVPPASMQDAVLEELSEPRADALAVLYRLISRITEHPVTTWLETSLPARLAAGGAVGGPSGVNTLAEIAQDLRGLAVPEGVDRSCSAWLIVARKAAAALDDVASIPPGAGQLAILEFALARFHESLGALSTAEGPTIERLRSVTQAMVEIAEQEVHAMQRSGTLDIDVTPAEVEAGVTSEVRLRVTNSSPVPLRSVRVTARQADGTVDASEVAYLPERDKHEIPVAVRAQDLAQSVRIAVAWQARRLDATAIQGEKELPLLVRSSSEAADQGDLGPNPYITGSTGEYRPHMFFGREGVMEQIRRQLGASDHANVILLEGNRRTGKTSILKIIEKTDVLDGWIPVYCSLQGNGIVSTRDFFRVLARETGYALHGAGVATWLPGVPEPESGRPFHLSFRESLNRAFAAERVFETFQVYLSAAVEAASPLRILLMLDEFDELQGNIDAGLISPQVPKNLRHLLQHQSGICAIITGSRRLKRLREDYWSALFGLGYRIGISELPITDAKRLVTEPVVRQLRYLPQACDRLVELCSCHPYLVQLLCSRVFDRAAAGDDRTITKDIVEQAATGMVGDNEHFQTLWDYAGTERRRLILMLCDRLADSPDAVNLDLLGVSLQSNGVPVRGIKELADDIAELRELELIDLDKSYRGGTYRLCVPLMAKWMQRNIDFQELVARAAQEATLNR